MTERERLEMDDHVGRDAPPDGASCGCDVRPIAAHFDVKARGSDSAAATAAPALHATTRALLDMLGDARGRSVLELGCGQGGLLLTVLRAGATGVTGADVSRASIDVARSRIAEAGFADSARFEAGDAAVLPLERHDWVVVDRVICCYPEAELLIRNSAAAAGSRYAFSVPNSRGFWGIVARLVWAADNFLDRFRPNSCPGYIHDLDRIEGSLGDLGFSRAGRATRGMWYAAVFERIP